MQGDVNFICEEHLLKTCCEFVDGKVQYDSKEGASLFYTFFDDSKNPGVFVLFK